MLNYRSVIINKWQNVEYYLPLHIFYNFESDSRYDTHPLIQSNNLFMYVEDNTIQLEVSNLIAVWTPEFIMRGLPWYIMV